jgi:hypothetical protein
MFRPDREALKEPTYQHKYFTINYCMHILLSMIITKGIFVLKRSHHEGKIIPRRDAEIAGGLSLRSLRLCERLEINFLFFELIAKLEKLSPPAEPVPAQAGSGVQKQEYGGQQLYLLSPPRRRGSRTS